MILAVLSLALSRDLNPPVTEPDVPAFVWIVIMKHWVPYSFECATNGFNSAPTILLESHAWIAMIQEKKKGFEQSRFPDVISTAN